MKYKLLCLLLCIFVLAGCAAETQETETPEHEETQAVSDSESTYDQQLQTIYDNADTWRLQDADNVGPSWYCFYAITDLDHDGYLEVIKRTEYNNGPNTQLWIYEVTEDGGITELESELEEPGSDYRTAHYPEFSLNRPTAYYEEDGVYRYLLCDCISYGVACVYNHYGYLSIQDDRIYFDFVCTELAEDAGSLVTYYDGDNNMISEDDYNALHNDYIANTDGEVIIEWFDDCEGEALRTSIENSYLSFAG